MSPAEQSMQRSLCAAMLVLQAVVLGLTTPVMTSVADVELAVALSVGLGLAAACVLTAGLLRARWAYALGWAIQVASIAVGFLVTMMFLLGVVFAALWAAAYLLGAQIDTERLERAR
jgi:high-affinity Fe2+/Pb2+ permease